MVGRDQLFGERSDLGFTQWGAERDLDARLGESVKPWTLHDLRRTCATGMADIGVQPHIIEAVLNHVSGHKVGVAGIYNRSSYPHWRCGRTMCARSWRAASARCSRFHRPPTTARETLRLHMKRS